MDNTTTGYNDNPVVKTVYDPCPAGFHVPESNAFTGFVPVGGSDLREGAYFYNKATNPDAKIYFYGKLARNHTSGDIYEEMQAAPPYGFYWTANLQSIQMKEACSIAVLNGVMVSKYRSVINDGNGIHPAAE